MCGNFFNTKLKIQNTKFKRNKMKEKFITTNELANDASKVLRSLKPGEGTVILRYSKPVGALIAYEDYKKIEKMESEFVQECKNCLSSIKLKTLNTKQKNGKRV